MRHARLLLDLTLGVLWAGVVGVTAVYLALNEDFLRAFDRWRR